MWDLKKTLDFYNFEIEYAKRTTKGFLLKLCPDQDPARLLDIQHFNDIFVTVSMPDHLNLIKGIIHHPELAFMLEDEVLEMTKSFGVIKVSKPQEASYAILAWKRTTSAALPETVLVAWDRVRVKPCLPRPRRCYCCQNYGHTAADCTSTPVCSRCGQEHEAENCSNNPKCAACGGQHTVNDPNCPKWIEEKAVMKIRHEKKLSYSQAVKQKKKEEKEAQEQKIEEEAQEQKNEEQEQEEEQQVEEKQEEHQQEEDEDEDSDEEIEIETQQEEDKEQENSPEQQRGRSTVKKHPGGWQLASSRKKKK